MRANFFVKRGIDFLEGIKKTEELFGWMQMVLLVSGLLSIVLTFFTMFTLFFEPGQLQDPRVFTLWCGLFGVSMVGILIAIFMPQMTQELLTMTSNLIKKLDGIKDVRDKDMIIYLDNNVRSDFSEAKSFLAKRLKEFQGFNVLDFFTLRKSLLTTILAHFVTYLIVLLQFKVSESNSHYPVNCTT